MTKDLGADLVAHNTVPSGQDHRVDELTRGLRTAEGTDPGTGLLPTGAGETSLLDATGEVAAPTYDRAAVRVGIAHFGVGNFHRVHEAVFIDRALHLPNNEGWGIVGIGIRDGADARAKAATFAGQDCLYTVTQFAPDGTSQARVIGAMKRYLHAPSDPEAVLAQLSDPALRIVSMTITEGGYLLDETTGRFLTENAGVQHDLVSALPQTVFGFLVRALARRRAAGHPPFTVVSCDNVRHNGDTTRRAVVGFARALDEDVAAWIEQEVSFPNSMVDRIAPYVTTADRDRLNAGTHLPDAIPAMSENYLQWVIEDRFPAGRPDLHLAGVELRDDVAVFEAVKQRLLNASHALLSYPSLLLGYRFVDHALADRRIRALIDVYMTDDVIPLLDGPAGMSLIEYKNTIIDRFANPAIGDQLIRIATDGAAKIPVFHAKTIQELIAAGRDVRREAFLLACYGAYLGGVDDLGETIDLVEPTLGATDRNEIRADDGLGLLRIPAFSALRVQQSEDFVAAYRSITASLRSIGTAGTIDLVLADRSVSA